MPQEHYVLRCFSCETFQAHIVKKAKKWECKMCGEKQSVKRNYGRGNAKDCRNQVMKLNELRLMNGCKSDEAEDCIFEDDFRVKLKEESEPNKPFTSKWEKYLDEPMVESENEAENIEDTSMGTEGKKKKRIRNMQDCSNKNKKICMEVNQSKASLPIYDQLFSPPNSEKNNENYKCNEKSVKKTSSIEGTNKLSFNKYDKYLDDDEDIKNNLTCTLNIFESDLNDLDNILNLD